MPSSAPHSSCFRSQPTVTTSGNASRTTLDAEPPLETPVEPAQPVLAADQAEDPATSASASVPVLELQPDQSLAIVPPAFRRTSNAVLVAVAAAAVVVVGIAGSTLLEEREGTTTSSGPDPSAALETLMSDAQSTLPPSPPSRSPTRTRPRTRCWRGSTTSATATPTAAWAAMGDAQAHFGSQSEFESLMTDLAEGYGAWSAADPADVQVTPVSTDDEGTTAVVTLIGTVHLRPCRDGRHRSHQRAARHIDRRHRRIPPRHLAVAEEVDATLATAVRSDMFTDTYATVFDGDAAWRGLETPSGERFAWEPASTYVRLPPFLTGVTADPPPLTAEIVGARALAHLGDSVTTDHISPAGSIAPDSPAGQWLVEQGVQRVDFNSYGSRRGNHEVMIRGTFANGRIRNQLAGGTEGGVTVHLPDGEPMSIYDAAVRYREEGVALVVLAGKEYGSGSSRDWAAKGTALLGVRAVLAESFERIHRSNLVDMGVLPLQYADGESAATLGLTGREQFDLIGMDISVLPASVTVRADGREFQAKVRIDTAMELDYYRHGGILPYVLRARAADRPPALRPAFTARSSARRGVALRMPRRRSAEQQADPTEVGERVDARNSTDPPARTMCSMSSSTGSSVTPSPASSIAIRRCPIFLAGSAR